MAELVVNNVTDASFTVDVLDRSETLPIIVDLWAPWCGPCRTLGPIIESIVAGTDGAVELVKINVDENPRSSQTFQIQSIPAVYAVVDRKIVDGFIGAQSEFQIRQFIERIMPGPSELDLMLERADEPELRTWLEEHPGDEAVVCAVAEMAANDGRTDEALALLGRIPPSGESRRIAAIARQGLAELDGVEARLDALLSTVKSSPDDRQSFLDLLELMGPDDERTTAYRRRLTTALY